MTTEEKIKRISEVTLENTQKECDKSLSEYKARLDKQYDEKMNEAKKKAQLKLESAKEELLKQAKKEVANEQICLKRKLNSKQLELKNILMEEIQKQLVEYTQTEDYLLLLEQQIKEALDLAAGNSVNIYLDAGDEDKKSTLEGRTNSKLLIYKSHFLGGTIAEIPVKNILIDNSFETRLESIMENYTVKV